MKFNVNFETNIIQFQLRNNEIYSVFTSRQKGSFINLQFLASSTFKFDFSHLILCVILAW